MNLDPNVLEYGRWLFAQECRFMRGVQSLRDLPPSDLPEVAFAGRSNVGKSSLINALTGRKILARTSVTPGRTQQLNFFCLADRIYLVDMPGYGYAQAPREQIKIWTDLIHCYLHERTSLRRVYLLIDARHGIKENDQEIMKMLDQIPVSYQIVLTKTDKVTPTMAAALKDQTEKDLANHPAAFPHLLATSVTKGLGIAELRASIATWIENDDASKDHRHS